MRALIGKYQIKSDSIVKKRGKKNSHFLPLSSSRFHIDKDHDSCSWPGLKSDQTIMKENQGRKNVSLLLCILFCTRELWHNVFIQQDQGS